MKRTLPLLLCLTALAPSLPEHGGQTLLRLSRTPRTNAPPATVVSSPIQPLPSIMPPALSTNLLRAVPRTNGPQNFTIAFPRTSPTNLYCLMHSVDLKSWTMIRSNMIGVQSTNADVFTTNRGGREFFRLDRQTNFYTVRP